MIVKIVYQQKTENKEELTRKMYYDCYTAEIVGHSYILMDEDSKKAFNFNDIDHIDIYILENGRTVDRIISKRS